MKATDKDPYARIKEIEEADHEFLQASLNEHSTSNSLFMAEEKAHQVLNKEQKMKITFVQASFASTPTNYSYFTTQSVKVGDFALVLTPRGLSLVVVNNIEKPNKRATQPLVQILDLEALTALRDGQLFALRDERSGNRSKNNMLSKQLHNIEKES